MRIAPLVLRPFCRHKETILRVDEKHHRLYTECTSCLHRSPGITTEKAYVPARRIATSTLNKMLEATDAR